MVERSTNETSKNVWTTSALCLAFGIPVSILWLIGFIDDRGISGPVFVAIAIYLMAGWLASPNRKESKKV